MSIFSSPSFDDHKGLFVCCESSLGLKAIVAIHRLYDGRSAGGIRFQTYASDQEALEDVLRLSRGMTYKWALAGFDLGGAKSVILGNPSKLKTPALLTHFAEFIDSLGGRYICGPDVGTDDADIAHVAKTTKYALGRAGESGDPSPATALGVYQGIRAALEARRGSDNLEGIHVAVQGLGKVGKHLCRLLAAEGATLSVADVDTAKVDLAVSKFDACPAALSEIVTMECDVFAPCAVGGVINSKTSGLVSADIVCGAANNQLHSAEDGRRLHERGILYVPDYAVNSGGAIKCVMEGPDYDEEKMTARVKEIRTTIRELIALADERKLPTSEAADLLAENRIKQNSAHYS